MKAGLTSQVPLSMTTSNDSHLVSEKTYIVRKMITKSAYLAQYKIQHFIVTYMKEIDLQFVNEFTLFNSF